LTPWKNIRNSDNLLLINTVVNIQDKNPGKRPFEIRLPDDKSIDAVIVWADLDNYTSICDFLTKRARLKKFMQQFYEEIDACIENMKQYADVRREKFVGDGVLILIPIKSETEFSRHPDLEKEIDPGKLAEIRAIHVGLTLAYELNNDLWKWTSFFLRPGAAETWERFLGPVLKDNVLQFVIGIHKGSILKINEPSKGRRYEICGTPINIACSLTSLDQVKEYAGSNIFVSEEAAEMLEIMKKTAVEIKKFKRSERKLRHFDSFPFRYNLQ
jgi:class 3 adenylate cyclase